MGATASAHVSSIENGRESGLQSRSGESARAAASARIASSDTFTGLETPNDVEVDVVIDANRISGPSRPTSRASPTAPSPTTHIFNQQAGTHPLKYLKNLRLLHEKPDPPMQESRRTT